MRTILLALLSWGDIDACRLGADSFDARQAAHARLERMGWLAWPALWRREADPDPEVRHRARRLLRGQGPSGIADAALAAWLFYGPDEAERPNHRYLCEKRLGGFLAKHCIGDATMLRLVALARRWGLLDDSGITLPELDAGMGGWRGNATIHPDARWSWINLVRWRAIGNREHGKGR